MWRERLGWYAWLAGGVVGAQRAELVADLMPGDPPLVRLCFSRPVRFLVLDAEGAVQLAHELLQAAEALADEGGDVRPTREVVATLHASMTRH